MVFSSAAFLFCFLPVVFILYSAVPGLKGKNTVLTIASLLFYAYGEPTFVLVMIASVLFNFLLAKGIASASVSGNKASSRALLVIAVIFNLGLIGVFKYAGFFVETINGVTGLALHVPEIALPIGISFFTFQVLSYVIDVYREPEQVQKSFWKLLLYVSFFPQLIAGPIVKYHDIAEYLEARSVNKEEIVLGIQRFIVGLTKKMLLANTMGAISDQMFNLPASDMSAGTAWMGAVCYTLQIFFDFSGYSDMAIGIGHMFGFTFKENFDHPYISTSIKEFWRRWHISLSTWFKEYLYIPLGGNRKGQLRANVNKLIVFFFTGMWHGASWNFVVWGMIHGVAIVIEDVLGLGKKTKGIGSFLGWLYTIFIVICAFVLFRADTWEMGLNMLGNMFTGGAGSLAAYNACMEALNPYNILMFAIAVIVCVPIEKLQELLLRRTGVFPAIATAALLLLCILDLASASFNPFIYFRF